MFTILLPIGAWGNGIRISNNIKPVEYFVGRELELQAIEHNFNQKKNIISLVGFSGIGKTQIVRKYIELNKGEYDIVWFFDCNENLKYQFKDLAVKINTLFLKDTKQPIGLSLDTVQNEVLNFIKSKENWLFVFDNLKIGENSKLNEIIDAQHNGKIIIVSQDHANLPNIIEVKQLNSNDEKILIDKVANSISADNKARIIKSFGGYPIGIVRAATFLNQYEYLDIEEYKNLEDYNHLKANIKNLIRAIIDKADHDTKNLLVKSSLADTHKINQKFMVKIIGGNKNISPNLYNLNRFSIITHVQNKKKSKEFFEMHDLIKASVHELTKPTFVKENLQEILNNISSIFPLDVSSFTNVLEEYPNLRENIEAILLNCDLFQVPAIQTLNLRMNLMRIYMQTLDYNGLAKLVKWMSEQDQKGEFSGNILSHNQRGDYCWSMIYCGIYYDFANWNSDLALSYYSKVLEQENFLENNLSNLHLKFTLYAQISQSLLYSGDIDGSLKNLKLAEKYIKQIDGKADWGLMWFLESMILYQNGNYQEALNVIEKSIDYEAQFPQGQFTAPPYLLKAELLLKLNKPNEAYVIAKKTFDLNNDQVQEEHEFKARLLLTLARTAFVTKKDSFKNNLDSSISILVNLPPNKGKKIEEITDEDLAKAYTLLGDSYYESNNYISAIKEYELAYRIYKNRFRDKLKNDYVSCILLKIIKSYVKTEKQDIALVYLTEHNNIFGLEHFRTKELYSLVGSQL